MSDLAGEIYWHSAASELRISVLFLDCFSRAFRLSVTMFSCENKVLGQKNRIKQSRCSKEKRFFPDLIRSCTVLKLVYIRLSRNLSQN